MRSKEIAQGGSGSARALSRRARWSLERRYYFGFSVTLVAAVLLGFSRTFFLRFWFPDWAAAHGAPEPFFYFHGLVFAAWFVLLVAQTFLVASRRVDLHRRLGTVGAGLAVAMLATGVIAALVAAARPTGFMDMPLPPLQFLLVPLVVILLFGIFALLAVVKRRDVQSHKRYMLLASITLLDAAVARWPFSVMAAECPLPGFTTIDVVVDLFLVPMIAWDVVSGRRVHPVTLWGGLALIASQPLRHTLADTDAWRAVAAWAVSLLGH